jgi:hypothetical protein
VGEIKHSDMIRKSGKKANPKRLSKKESLYSKNQKPLQKGEVMGNNPRSNIS